MSASHSREVERTPIPREGNVFAIHQCDLAINCSDPNLTSIDSQDCGSDIARSVAVEPNNSLCNLFWVVESS